MDTLQTVLKFTKTGHGCSLFCNLGNTCYLNSALQVLMNIPDMENVIVNTESKYSSEEMERKVWYRIIRGLYKGYWEEDCTIRPIALVQYLHKTSHFQVPIQSDSTEVLTYIIQQLHDDIGYSFTNAIKPDMSSLEQRAVQEWNSHNGNKKSPLTKLFYGQFQVSVRCSKCKSTSARFETFNCVPLQIVSEDEVDQRDHPCIDLSTCFQRFHRTEHMDDDNKYHCEKCNELVVADRQSGFYWLPKYMIIQFKKYYKTRSGRLEKSTREIKFPESFDVFDELIITNQYYADKNPKYRLQSGVMHHGSTINSGHYNCFVFNPDINDWLLMDDEEGKQIETVPHSLRSVTQLVYKLELDE